MNYTAKDACALQGVPGAVPGTLGAICEQLDSLLHEAHSIRDRSLRVESSIVGARSIPPAGGNPNVKAVQSCFIDKADEKLNELRGVLDAIGSSLANIEEKL